MLFLQAPNTSQDTTPRAAPVRKKLQELQSKETDLGRLPSVESDEKEQSVIAVMMPSESKKMAVLCLLSCLFDHH